MIIIAAAELPAIFHLLAIMMIAVLGVSLLLLKVQRSLLVAYFVCGVIIANSGIVEMLGEKENQLAMSQMAEIGVMLLMFVLGMEFSVRELKFLRHFSFIGGGAQMAICSILAALVAKLLGLPWPAAIIIGAAFGMSSTAVSLKSFQDMGLAGSAGARFALGIAIFQDLFIIAFLVFLPLLTLTSAATGSLSSELIALLIKGSLFVVIAWVTAKWVIPALLQSVARTRIRELFSLAVVGSCLGLAWIGSLLDLSLALGAFVAGLAVSESVFKHRILADITPMKDVFLTLFFVSVGLMVDLKVAIQYWYIILIITAVVLVCKTTLIFAIARLLKQGNRTASLGALSLCSAGEFSLLLFQKAGGAGLWSETTQQCLVATAAISMALVPGLMKLAHPFSRLLDKRSPIKPAEIDANDQAKAHLKETIKEIENHAIICGYGPVGRAVHESLLRAGIPCLIIELNVETVQELTTKGTPVLFADASHEETWKLARLAESRLVAFTIPDFEVTAEGLKIVREDNPDICVLVRSRFANDRERIEALGASTVLLDENEIATSAASKALEMANRQSD